VASSSEMGRTLRKALFARRASHAARASGDSVAGSTLRRRLESRASRLMAFTASCASCTAARTRVESSEASVRSVSWRPVRIASALRVSVAATVVATGVTVASVVVGTTTDAWAGALRLRAGAATGAATVAGAATVSVFLGILFDLLWETEDDISNALGILYDILTCLNHNLWRALNISKHISCGSLQSFKILKIVPPRYINTL